MQPPPYSEKGQYPPSGPPPPGAYPPPGAPPPGAYPPPGAPPPGAYPPPGAPPPGAPPPGAYPPPGAPPPGAYPPPGAPPPGAYPQQGYTQTTVITAQPTSQVIAVSFGEMPVSCTCPHCKAQVVTAVRHEPGTMAWIICCILLFVFWPLMCLPFCVTGFQDVIHTCPNCSNQIGALRR